jgi:hypothetical protein
MVIRAEDEYELLPTTTLTYLIDGAGMALGADAGNGEDG